MAEVSVHFWCISGPGLRPPEVPPSWRKMIGQWTSMKIPKVNHPELEADYLRFFTLVVPMGPITMGWSSWLSHVVQLFRVGKTWTLANTLIWSITVSLEGMEWSCENHDSAIWKMSETKGIQNPDHPVNSMSTSLPTFIPSSKWFHKEVP